MGSLGIRLRELRLAKGVSLDDIARSTRVGRRHLEALESDSLGELPSPVFVKGFIRGYCQFLEVSPDEALALYLEVSGEGAKPDRAQGVAHTPPMRRAGPLMVSLILFLALGASLFALRFGMKGSAVLSSAVSGPARTHSESVPSSVPTAVTTATPAPAQPVPGQAAEPRPSAQRLVIRAVESTWIRVQVDEGQTTEELMPAGAVREWVAERGFVLTVGNAGGLEVDLNGRRIPSLGAKGAVIQRLALPAEAQGAGS